MKKRKDFLKKAVLYVLVLALLPLNLFVGTGAAAAGTTEYQIYPIPQQITYSDSVTALTSEVNVIVESGVDAATQNHLIKVLALRGLTGKTGTTLEAGKLNVLVGIRNSGEFVDTYASPNVSNADAFFSNSDAYILSIENNVITILAKDTDAAFYGVTTLKAVFQQLSDNTVQGMRIEDFSDTAWRGFIEGYYGLPYSTESRQSLMEFCSDYKMNSYIFAPKDDPYHQSQWRTPYPDSVMNDTIKPLIEKGNETKVHFVFAIHPFMSNPITTATFDADIPTIIGKYEQMYAAGVRQFALLGDDAGGEVSLHVKVINALNDWVKSKPDTYSLIFCPNAYSGTPDKNYFSVLNEVDPDVQVMYTGSAIIGNVDETAYQNFYNAFVSAEHPTGREPYVWLNWPVNDYTDASIFLGKGQMLKQGVKNFNGLVSNPMCEAQLSKIALFQIADFVWNSDSFNEEKSWTDSFARVDPDAADELAVLAKHMNYPKDGVYHTTGLAWDESEELAPLMQEFQSKLLAGEDIHTVSETLIQRLEEIKTAAENLPLKSKNEQLKKEIAPYLTSLSATVEADLSIVRCALALADNDINTAWTQYSGVASNIERSNSVTKPGFKPEGYVNLDVRPGTKYLRPFARNLASVMDGLVKKAMGLDSSSAGERTPISHFGSFTASEAELLKLFDGDASTYLSLQNGTQKMGDYVGVDLGGIFPLKHISILQGSSDTDHDIMHYAVLEVSIDGSNWTLVGDYSQTAATNRVECDTTEKARYVRFRLTQEGYNGKPDYWLHIREFVVETGSPIEAISDGNIDATVTEAGNSVMVSAKAPATLSPGQYFGLKLPQLVSVDVSGTPSFQGLTLQASDNAKNWTDVGAANTVAARYLRLINNGTTAVAGVTPSLQVAVAKIDPPSVTVDGSTLAPSADLLFDGQEATQGRYDAKSVTVDLGQMVQVSSLSVSVAEDTADSRLLGAGSVELSEDGVTFTPVRAYNITDKSADPNNSLNFDSHQAPYFYLNIELEAPASARYIRIHEAVKKEFVINELLVNRGAALPSSVDQSIQLNGSYLDGYSIDKANDGKLDTYFRANAAEPKGGSIVYTFTQENFPKTFSVIQNANTLSNAKAEALLFDGTWHGLGTLGSAVNRFDLSALSNARAVRISWTSDTQEFYLHELSYEQMPPAEAVQNTANSILAADYTDSHPDDVDALKAAANQLLSEAASLSAEEAAVRMEALRKQEASLRPLKIDMDALIELVNKVSGTDLKDYVGGPEGNQAFADALKKAQELVETPSAAQEEIAAAYNALRTAYNALVKRASEQTLAKLSKFLDDVAGLNENDYLPETWQAISNAAAHIAEALQGDVSEEEGKNLLAQMNDAQAFIDNPDAVPIHTDALQGSVNEALKIDLNNYMGGIEGNSAFTEALQKAQALLENPTSQQEVDQARLDLDNARNALVRRASPETMQALRNFVDNVKKLDASKYQEATWKTISDIAGRVEAALAAGEIRESDAAALLTEAANAQNLIDNPDAGPDSSSSSSSQPDPSDPSSSSSSSSQPESSGPDSSSSGSSQLDPSDPNNPSSSSPSLPNSGPSSSTPGSGTPSTGDFTEISAIALIMAAAGCAFVWSHRKKQRRDSTH